MYIRGTKKRNNDANNEASNTKKIPSQMEVAPRPTLPTRLTLFIQFTLLLLLYCSNCSTLLDEFLSKKWSVWVTEGMDTR